MILHPNKTRITPQNEKGGRVRKVLSNEKGITLLEVMVTAIVIVGTILSIYIGIVYAEKQILRNYRDRVATLLASGELEWQYFHYTNYNGAFAPYNNRSVVIDYLPKGKQLTGTMTVSVTPTAELYGSLSLPYYAIQATVRWIEPGDNRERSIILREDIYR